MSLFKRSPSSPAKLTREPITEEASPQKPSKKAGFISFKSFSKTSKQKFSKYDQLFIFEGMSLIIDQKLKAATLYFKDMSPSLAPLFKQSLFTILSSTQYSLKQKAAILKLAARILPKDPQLITRLSQTYRDLGVSQSNLHQALHYFQQAYNCLPKGAHGDKPGLIMDMTNTCFSLGRTDFQSKQYDNALFFFQTAKKLCPHSQKLLHRSILQWIQKVSDIQATLNIGKRFRSRFFPQKQPIPPRNIRKKSS